MSAGTPGTSYEDRRLTTRIWAGAVSAIASARRSSIVQSTVVNFSIVGVTTVAGILVARSLGAEGRGYYAAIMAWFAISQVVGELGQSGAVTYWVSKDPQRGKDYVASARALMLVAGGLVSAVGIFISDILSGGIPSVALAYQIAFGGCLLNSVCASAVYAIQAISIGRWNFVRLSQPVAYLLIVAALFTPGVLDIVSLSTALVGSIAVQFVVAIAQGVSVGIMGGKLRRRLLQELLNYGSAYAGSAVPASLSSQYDRVVLSRLTAPSQLGQYAVASTVASLAAPLSTAVSSVVFPLTARGSLGEDERRKIERRAILGTVLASAAISTLIAATIAPLIPSFFGAEFHDAVWLVWWLMPAMFFRSVSQVISALLRGRRRPGLATYGQLSGLLVGGLSIFPLIAWLDVRGAAISTALAELVVLVVASIALARLKKTMSLEEPTKLDDCERAEAARSSDVAEALD